MWSTPNTLTVILNALKRPQLERFEIQPQLSLVYKKPTNSNNLDALGLEIYKILADHLQFALHFPSSSVALGFVNVKLIAFKAADTQ